MQVVRKHTLGRVSCLFAISVQVPKLDVAGSIPVSRSMFSTVYHPWGSLRTLLNELIELRLSSETCEFIDVFSHECQPYRLAFSRALFDNTVEFLTASGHPPTCMTLAGAAGCSVDATPARDIMTEIP